MDRREIMQGIMQNMETLMRAAINKEPCVKDSPTRAQMGIMFAIFYNGTQSIKELAGKFSMTSSAATQLVNGLVKDGFLTRAEDETDRRRIDVSLSAKGKKAIDGMKKKRYQEIKNLLSPLTDKELLQLNIIQQKIAENLKTICNKHQNSK